MSIIFMNNDEVDEHMNKIHENYRLYEKDAIKRLRPYAFITNKDGDKFMTESLRSYYNMLSYSTGMHNKVSEESIDLLKTLQSYEQNNHGGN